MKKNSTVVIIGRINVGKSALFNRLTETSKALVSKIPGTTRDYNSATVSWRAKNFTLIDTGGINSDLVKNSIKSLITKKSIVVSKTKDPIEKEIVEQTRQALKKATLVLMVVDGQSGLLPHDKELAGELKKLPVPIILVANKIDSQKYQPNVSEFFKLGLGNPEPVSAANGVGTGDLLDIVVKFIKNPPGRPSTAEYRPIKVALVGKPNVGKSTLVNQILGEKRVITSPIAQTTREPQDTEIIYKKQHITLIDTAGLRKQANVEPGLEKISTKKTKHTIQQADVVLFMTEAQNRLTTQDTHLGGMIKDAKRGIILIGNKWDLLPDKSTQTDKEMINYYRAFFPFLHFAPLLFTSAETGKNTQKILDMVLEVHENRNRSIDQKDLDELKKKLTKKHRPVQAKGLSRPRILNIKQVKIHPPVFAVKIGKEQTLHFSYIRFIENQIRQHFEFTGAPITIDVKTTK